MSLLLVLDNIRSAYNVGSILRTADAVGVERVICIGTTPYPALSQDSRPGHVTARNTKEIAKTALGAEQTISISYEPELRATLEMLKNTGVTIIALEQSGKSTNLFDFTYKEPIALVIGNEINGVHPDNLALADHILEIPMSGTKESLNVAVATGIALYQLAH